MPDILGRRSYSKVALNSIGLGGVLLKGVVRRCGLAVNH